MIRSHVGVVRDVDLGSGDDSRKFCCNRNFLARGLSSFITIGSGAAGCVVAGILADRIGRTTVASAAMMLSGSPTAKDSLRDLRRERNDFEVGHALEVAHVTGDNRHLMGKSGSSNP